MKKSALEELHEILAKAKIRLPRPKPEEHGVQESFKQPLAETKEGQTGRSMAAIGAQVEAIRQLQQTHPHVDWKKIISAALMRAGQKGASKAHEEKKSLSAGHGMGGSLVGGAAIAKGKDMPGKVDEKKWQRAKEIVAQQKGHAPKGDEYALVQHVYQGMKKEEESNADMAEATTTNIERKAKRLKALMNQATEDTPPWVVGKLAQAKTHVQDAMDYVGTDGTKKSEMKKSKDTCENCGRDFTEENPKFTSRTTGDHTCMECMGYKKITPCAHCGSKSHDEIECPKKQTKKSEWAGLDEAMQHWSLGKSEPLNKWLGLIPVKHKGEDHVLVGYDKDKKTVKLRPFSDPSKEIEVAESEIEKPGESSGEAPKCECGAVAAGIVPKGHTGREHSHWCPSFSKSEYWDGLSKAMKDWLGQKGVHHPVAGKPGVSDLGEIVRELSDRKQKAKGKFIEPEEYMKIRQLTQKAKIRLEEIHHQNKQLKVKPVGGDTVAKPTAEEHGVKESKPTTANISVLQDKLKAIKDRSA